METTTQATWTKLRDGSWGVRYHGTVSAGTTVEVSKRDGSTSLVEVRRVLWTGTDRQGDVVSLLAVQDQRSTRRAPRGRACITGGNCSSFGDGRSCGGYDCDGY